MKINKNYTDAGNKNSPLDKVVDHINSKRIWFKEIELSRGEFLKLENTIDTNLYLIDEGSLRFFYPGRSR